MRLEVPSPEPEASAEVDAPPDAENRSLTQLDVLIAEARALHGQSFDRLFVERSGEAASGDDAPRRAAFHRAIGTLAGDDERTALCLSGGGIRSATFALGVLQGLAREKLLESFHYLSTVSGGGYIGSWLSAWRARGGSAAAIDGLAAQGSEPAAVGRLRAYSNYLAPRRGLSTDLLAVLGLVARNLLLHWLILLPALAAALLAPRLYLELLREGGIGAGWPSWLALVGSLLLVVVVVEHTWRQLPALGQPLAPGSSRWPFAVGLPAAALILPLVNLWVEPPPPPRLLVCCVLGGVGIALVGVAIGSLRSKRLPPWRSTATSVAGGAVAGALLGVAFGWVLPGLEDAGLGAYAVLAPPALLAIHWLGTSVCVGLTSDWAPEEAREWWAWSAAVTMLPLLIWLAGSALTLFGPLLLLEAGSRASGLLVLAGGGSGVASALIGLWGRGGARQSSADAPGWKARLERFLLPIAATAFLALVAIGVALAAERLLEPARFARAWGVADASAAAIAKRHFRDDERLSTYRRLFATSPERGEDPVIESAMKQSLLARARKAFDDVLADGGQLGARLAALSEAYRQEALGPRDPGASPRFAALALAMACLLALGAGAAGLFGVNRFSLHSLYGNRLVRAYLGASNQGASGAAATRHPYTLFDPEDNVRMHELLTQEEEGPRRLFHVLNLAVNVTDGSHLDWQERQAASFTVSPLHCGSGSIGYRPSRAYGGSEGMSLGKALTISGAAVSPGMGHYSSMPVAAVMTLFNTRLGWWLPNPGPAGKDAWKAGEPRLGLWPLLQELLSSFSLDRSFVFLSDGGHFDNLGLYEMVVRRCRRIVVVDAGCDPGYEYEDLARTIRLIRTDLGIEIDIDDLPTGRPGDAGRRHAVGRIRYSDVDPETADGVLLVIKPLLDGSEPLDLRRFARARARAGARFPQETTGDQFFDEAQFESYRRLGLLSAEEASGSLRSLFQASARGFPQLLLEQRGPLLGAAAAAGAAGAAPGGGEAARPDAASWSRLLEHAPAWVAPALASTVAAVTVTTVVTGSVQLASAPLRLESAAVGLAQPAQVQIDPASRVALTWPPELQPATPSESAGDPAAPAPPRIQLALDPKWNDDLRALLDSELRVAPQDLQKIERLAASLRSVEIPQAGLSAIEAAVRDVERGVKDLADKVDDIDPRGVVGPGAP